MTVQHTVSVVGLGKLGSPMLACFASKGHRVIGLDLDPQTVHLINKGLAPVFEPGLEGLLTQHVDRIHATRDYGEAVGESEISFVMVPTPTDETGGFSTDYVLRAMESIGTALKYKSSFHLVALTSTVMPGATERLVVPLLEECSGKKCGADFGVCYNPEFIALGSVIRDIRNPDFVLIGESDPSSGEMLERFYRTVCDNNPPIARMSLVNAELTKIALNTFVTAKISFANMLSEICDRLPGADVEVVTSALGLDTRIGMKYLRGATAYGGPCFPRDNLAFGHMAGLLGLEASMAKATDSINERQISRLVGLLGAPSPYCSTVGVLGLAYKPATNVVERSQGIALARELLGLGFKVIVHDPVAMETARQVLGAAVSYAASVEECVREADAVVITIPCHEFRALSPKDLMTQSGMHKKVIDCWRILEPKEIAHCCEYIALGVGPSVDKHD